MAAVAVAAVATASLGIIYATGVAAVATATQQAHVGSIGWMTPVQPGSVLGQPGQNRAIEAIKLTELPTGSTISAHVSSIGWMAPVGPGMVAGTTGRGLQMEAVKVTVPSGCTVTYQAYVRGQGWSVSVSNGAIAGTTGKALALDGLRVNAVTCATSTTSTTTPPVAGTQHAFFGGAWAPAVRVGEVIGQPGQNRAIEAIKLTELPTGSTISAHVSSIGWMAPVGPGMVAGTTGRGLQMEAVKVTVPSGCTVTYQAYVRGQGWSVSVSNGAIAGTTGKALALDGLRVNAVTCATTPPPASVKFAAVGDIGTDSENGSTAASSMLKGLGANGYNFALNLGDLGYNNNPGVEQNYCTFLKNNAGSSLQWLMVPGNHEGTDPTYGGPEGDYRKYVAYCAGSTPPAGVVGNYPYDYYVDRGNVRIIMLSPNISNPTGKLTYRNGTAEQAKLGTWIKGAKSAGKFVVVGAHEPYLTIGAHRLTPNNLADPQFAAFLVTQGVDLSLSGHDHNISRAYQIGGPVTSQTSPTVVDRDGSFVSGAGTVFAVLGTGGHSPREIGSLGSIWAMGSGTNSPGGISFGFGEITVSGNTLTYQLRTVSGPKLTDVFTIIR
ncbi:MAG TPA: metallophosphoesterase [Dermatophilaceae bacterium]|nr:metallophosphoesterase [Dermatophilaceae bacterium]